MQRASGALGRDERRAWQEDGFFIRPRLFDTAELARLRAAAERVAERALAVSRDCADSYEIDGNRYCEAAGATIQFEHEPGSTTIRVWSSRCASSSGARRCRCSRTS